MQLCNKHGMDVIAEGRRGSWCCRQAEKAESKFGVAQETVEGRDRRAQERKEHLHLHYRTGTCLCKWAVLLDIRTGRCALKG